MSVPYPAIFFRRFYYENYHYKPSIWKWRPGAVAEYAEVCFRQD